MKNKAQKYINMRIGIIGVMFLVLILAIGTKAVYLQLFCGSWLSERAANQYSKDLVTAGKRGVIYDRNHHQMAVSVGTTSLAAYPSQLQDKGSAARALAKILDINPRRLSKKIEFPADFCLDKTARFPQGTE